MDLPADKMKTLREFPSEKKWDIIRDSVSKRKILLDIIHKKKLNFRIKLLLNIHHNTILMV
jgi:hypothetical protein